MKNYYLFNPMTLSRKNNTLRIDILNEDGTDGHTKYLPIEDIDNLFVFGSLNINSAVLNFLGKQNVKIHFFDYYEHYTGSFMPKEYLLAGKVNIQQTKHYIKKKNRLIIAKKIIESSVYNILKNIKYYQNRGKNLENIITSIETLSYSIQNSSSIESLMGVEGNVRIEYYKAFNTIINDFEMNGRSKKPPKNEINTLISFGNSLCYASVISQIYHTQLNPTISFLHEPGFRRYSLALDIAEIFKPIITDRIIFKLLNKKEIKQNDFQKELSSMMLKEKAKKTFVQAFDTKLNETIKHRTLNKSVSYKYLIRLELYKLQKHILEIEEYKPLKMWW